MARFAGSSPPRRTALLGAPGLRKVMRRVSAFAMTYDSPNPKDLAYDGGGSGPVTAYATTGVSYTARQSMVTNAGSKYVCRNSIAAPAGAFSAGNWDPLYLDYAESGTPYTAWTSVVVYQGKHYLAKQTIAAPAGVFDPTKWQRLFVFAEAASAWLDATKGASVNAAGVHQILKAQGANHAIGQYNYLSDAMPGSASTNFNMAERAWLDANAGWATSDGTGLSVSYTKTGTCTPGSATILMADTTGLTVGMLAYGTGIDGNGRQAFIRSISAGVSVTLGTYGSRTSQGDYTGADVSNYTGITASGSTSITFDNLIWGEASRDENHRHVNIVNPAKDSEGLNYAQWLARQLNTVGLLAGLMPNVQRHCLDDCNPQEQWTIAGGEYVDYTWQRGNIYGTARWDGSTIRPSNSDPERAAHYQFKVDFFRALRKYNPGSRVWINGCVQGGLPALWAKEVDYTLMEGAFGASYAFDTTNLSYSGLEGWKQIIKQCKLNNETFSRFRYGNTINCHRYQVPGSGASSVTSQALHKDMLYGLCIALLTNSDFCFSDNTSGAIAAAKYRYYIPEFDIALGHGIEPVIDQDTPWTTVSGVAVWRREFQGGYVFVNPRQLAGSGNWDAAGYRATFTLPFDTRRPAGCLDPNTDASLGAADGELIPAGTPITMHSRSGLILLKV